jgi:hypothetical protein
VRILTPSAFNPLTNINTIDAAHPEYQWTLINCTYQQVP